MPRKKKQNDEEDVVPFDGPKEIRRDMYRFRCRDCAYEENVAGYVVEEFVWWEWMRNMPKLRMQNAYHVLKNKKQDCEKHLPLRLIF